jgi:hypothetical protein
MGLRLSGRIPGGLTRPRRTEVTKGFYTMPPEENPATALNS